MVLRRLNVRPLSPLIYLSFSRFSPQYEGERDLRTTIDFTSGGSQLKGANSASAGIVDSEDDDDDLSDTRPSKLKTCGTRSRPVRGATPTVSKFKSVVHFGSQIPDVKRLWPGSDRQSPRLPQ